ncbi:MAG: hypothetical protein NTAFB01_10020 [Nitrospira sp.]
MVFLARQIVLSDEVFGDERHTGLHYNRAVTETKPLWSVPNTMVCVAPLQALLKVTGEAQDVRLAESVYVINEP